MATLFGLSEEGSIYYKLQIITAGQWETLGMNRREALEYIKKFCGYLVDNDFKAGEFTDAADTVNQDALLSNRELLDLELIRDSVFDDEGRSNFEYIIREWIVGSLASIDISFEQIFGYPWKPVPPLDYYSMDPFILRLRRAAHDKYGTVGVANRVIEQFGADRLAKKSIDECLRLIYIRLARRGLTRGELHVLLMTTLAYDAGSSVSLDLTQCLGIVSTFADQAIKSGDPHQFVEKTFYSAQAALMAFRKDDFEFIQLEPPFSDEAVESMSKLVRAFGNGGRAEVKIILDSMHGESPARRAVRKPIRIVSGDGFSRDTAINFSPSEIEKRVRTEYWYINYSFGSEHECWERGVHFTDMVSTNSFSIWDVTLNDGSSKRLFFSTAGTIYKDE